MRRKSKGEYPPNWSEIATLVKEAADWKCIHCGNHHDPKTGHTLTVHHLDLDKSNCRWWNLAALCQRCHLHVQAKIVIEQISMFEYPDWFKPYAAGYYAHLYDLPDDRETVNTHLDKLILLGQGWRLISDQIMTSPNITTREKT